MDSSTYYELGFGTLGLAIVFGAIKNQPNYKPEKWRLENTLEILDHCERAFDIFKLMESYRKQKIRLAYRNLIWEQGEEDDEYWQVRTLAKIRRIKRTTEHILEGKEVSRKSIGISYDFFNDLSEMAVKITPDHDRNYGLSCLAA